MRCLEYMDKMKCLSNLLSFVRKRPAEYQTQSDCPPRPRPNRIPGTTHEFRAGLASTSLSGVTCGSSVPFEVLTYRVTATSLDECPRICHS